MCFRMGGMDQASLPARVGAIAVLDQPVRRDLYDLLVGTDGWIGREGGAGGRGGAFALLRQPVHRDVYDLLGGTDGWIGRDEAAAALGVPRSVAAFHLDK